MKIGDDEIAGLGDDEIWIKVSPGHTSVSRQIIVRDMTSVPA
jgi:hypothetical protein